jgi:nicotinic acid mononucleotide adenylyltransferase
LADVKQGEPEPLRASAPGAAGAPDAARAAPDSVVPAVEALVPYFRLLRSLDPAGPPRAVAVCGPALDAARRLVALPGSFNPPHRAHLALLAAAVRGWQADAAAYVLAARTVDKEQVSGLLLEDRLWLLCRLAGAGMPDPPEDQREQGEVAGVGASVVAANRGLYFEQAIALQRACPRLEALAFVVGYDKIVQIFDPRYYNNRDAALDALFSRASFLVAPRDDATPADLAALLAEPANRQYAGRVRRLALPAALAGISSSQVRSAAGASAAGDTAAAAPLSAPPNDAVPELVATFLRETGCYLPGGPYAARGAALGRAARGA